MADQAPFKRHYVITIGQHQSVMVEACCAPRARAHMAYAFHDGGWGSWGEAFKRMSCLSAGNPMAPFVFPEHRHESADSVCKRCHPRWLKWLVEYRRQIDAARTPVEVSNG